MMLRLTRVVYQLRQHRQLQRGSLLATGSKPDPPEPWRNQIKVDPASLPRLTADDSKDVISQRQTRIRRNLFFRFLDYLRNYDVLLAKVLPEKAIQASKMFINGSKLVLRDMKEYADIYTVLSATSDWKKACRTLTRRQLDLYRTLPNELMHVAPTLTIAALPMMHNVIFPLAMMYPKQMLSSHFWPIDTRMEVLEERQQQRHRYYRPIFRDIQRGLNKVTDPRHLELLRTLLSQLVSTNRPPTPGQVLALQDLFTAESIFSLRHVTQIHLRHLQKCHRVQGFTWKRYKLQQHGNLLLESDLAIEREGMNSININDLRYICFVRGLNARHLSQEELVKYLTTWLAITTKLDSSAVSLLLHLPILIGYNHPSRFWDDKSVD